MIAIKEREVVEFTKHLYSFHKTCGVPFVC